MSGRGWELDPRPCIAPWIQGSLAQAVANLSHSLWVAWASWMPGAVELMQGRRRRRAGALPWPEDEPGPGPDPLIWIQGELPFVVTELHAPQYGWRAHPGRGQTPSNSVLQVVSWCLPRPCLQWPLDTGRAYLSGQSLAGLPRCSACLPASLQASMVPLTKSRLGSIYPVQEGSLGGRTGRDASLVKFSGGVAGVNWGLNRALSGQYFILDVGQAYQRAWKPGASP